MGSICAVGTRRCPTSFGQMSVGRDAGMGRLKRWGIRSPHSPRSKDLADAHLSSDSSHRLCQQTATKATDCEGISSKRVAARSTNPHTGIARRFATYKRPKSSPLRSKPFSLYFHQPLPSNQLILTGKPIPPTYLGRCLSSWMQFIFDNPEARKACIFLCDYHMLLLLSWS